MSAKGASTRTPKLEPATRVNAPWGESELGSPAFTSLWREGRYGFELGRLLIDPLYLAPARAPAPEPVLLIPGFLAGDASLAPLALWLGRRGHPVASAGMLVNTECAERAIGRLEQRLERLADANGARVVALGQSRGGTLARALGARRPDLVSQVVMLGSPVLDPLAVGPTVRAIVLGVASLGERGLPGAFSNECRDGACCKQFRADLVTDLDPAVRLTGFYSRSDAIVHWRACLDPSGTHVEVDSSHCGMSVNIEVYRGLARILDDSDGLTAP